MRLPELDPAGSPRVAQNPYVPRLGVPAKRHVAEAPASACAKSAPSLGSTHEDAAGSGSQLFESAFTSHSVHGPELSGVTRAALGASPRSQALSDTAARLVQRKRLERLHDSYQTALSRETLLSEQYDKDLGAIRENLAKLASNQPADRAKAEVASQVRTRAKLERRVSGFEEKLNELDTYNGKLVGMISALRKQAEPHHHAEKRAKEALGKLTTGMAAQKAACHKALDERERMVDMIKHVQEDSYREENEFRNQIEMLKRDSDDLDVHNRQAEARMSAAEEFAKRQQCASMRTNRVHKERLEVRYGYLRSQLEGVDNDFRELQRIVGVHFQPSHPESLEQIIKKFVEKEGQVISLQRYFSLQSDEIELLLSQLARLTREEEAARATTRAAEAEAEAAASSGSKRAPYEDTDNVAQLERRFDEACCSIGRMFDDASCGTEPSGMHLATKGCSASTVHDFLSLLAARLDALVLSAHSLRERSVGQKKAQRNANEALDAFLRPRRKSAAETERDGGEGLGAPSPRGLAKEDIPSISDREPEDFAGDSEPTVRKGSKKGDIDKWKRDSSITAWVNRQNMVRGAQTARPTIREFYNVGERKWPQRAIYPPASAR